MEQRKVYDSDVATAPLLKAVAEQYAREYIGDFGPMIAAKQHVLLGGSLDGTTVRVVLNSLRYDQGRADLQGAVSAVLRRPSTPPPADLAKVVPIDPEARRRQRSGRSGRPVFIRYEPSQFTVRAPFATSVQRSHKPVLHWLRPTGHELQWRLRWERLQWEGMDSHEACNTMTAHGSGYVREFHLNVRAFCKHMNSGYYMLWSERPCESDVWPDKGEDVMLPDCKGCLRNIALEQMDMYPPDRDPSTGEYLL